MSALLNQLRHDLLFRARLSLPEVDALLALPELAVAAGEPSPAQVTLRNILRESPEAAALQDAIGTFHRDLTRPSGHETEEAAAEALANETTVSDLDPPAVVTEATVTDLPPLEDASPAE